MMDHASFIVCCVLYDVLCYCVKMWYLVIAHSVLINHHHLLLSNYCHYCHFNPGYVFQES
jgi:hypothetical protein